MFLEKQGYRISSPHLDYESVQSFSRRQDVEHALPYLSPRRKIFVTTVNIQARNGEVHKYFVLQQGRKRFLFDIQENPIPLTEASMTQRDKRLSFTLVVPQLVMQEHGYLQQGLKRFQSRRDAGRFFKMVEDEGYLAKRGDPEDPRSIENNTDFIQPIPAVVMMDAQNNILFTVRGGKNANHDKRLAGVIATPFTMGHSEPGDFGLWRRFLRYGLKLAMYREAAEETALQKGQDTFHVFAHRRNGHDYNVTVRGILNLHRFHQIKPFGVVYQEDTPIDTVHAGVIFVATPKRKDVSFVHNGSSREIHQVMPLSPVQYAQTIQEQGLTPASWNKPILEGIIPHLLSHPRHF